MPISETYRRHPENEQFPKGWLWGLCSIFNEEIKVYKRVKKKRKNSVSVGAVLEEKQAKKLTTIKKNKEIKD